MAEQEEVTLTAPPAADQEALRAARRRELGRMTKARLIRLCRAGVTTPGGSRRVIEGGMYPLEQWSKADIIAAIMSAEFLPEEASSPPGAPAVH
jgi:hypothetical protein